MDAIGVGMLKRRIAPARQAGQRGMVLLVALVVLVAIMVAGIAMMRSVDSANLVAGNLAFQQAATNAADQGIEKAIAMLRTRSATQLAADDSSNGYFASMASNQSPTGGQNWQSFWEANLKTAAVDAGTDQAGNHIYYVVHRECQANGLPGSGAQCVASPAVTTTSGNSEEAGELELTSASQIYYRITVRVSGPRRTESYVQSHIAM
jgi:Tfp pilus assembly protein PilX